MDDGSGPSPPAFELMDICQNQDTVATTGTQSTRETQIREYLSHVEAFRQLVAQNRAQEIELVSRNRAGENQLYQSIVANAFSHRELPRSRPELSANDNQSFTARADRDTEADSVATTENHARTLVAKLQAVAEQRDEEGPDAGRAIPQRKRPATTDEKCQRPHHRVLQIVDLGSDSEDDEDQQRPSAPHGKQPETSPSTTPTALRLNDDDDDDDDDDDKHRSGAGAAGGATSNTINPSSKATSKRVGLRRPEAEGAWWSVSVEGWENMPAETQKDSSRLGVMMETPVGADALAPCGACKEAGVECRVPSETFAARLRAKGRHEKWSTMCARCCSKKWMCSLWSGGPAAPQPGARDLRGGSSSGPRGTKAAAFDKMMPQQQQPPPPPPPKVENPQQHMLPPPVKTENSSDTVSSSPTAVAKSRSSRSYPLRRTSMIVIDLSDDDDDD